MYMQSRKIQWMLLLVAVCSGSFVVPVVHGQSDQKPATLSLEQAKASSSARPSYKLSARQTMLASRRSKDERLIYGALAGIDNLKVEATASGALLRFSYRVLDVNKAKALHDERSKPYLIDEKTGAVLQVPDLPKVGELRPKITPVNGKEYWMVFSNKGFIKPGSRVDIVIGSFRAVGLLVH
jgi:hypothetical protein